MFSLQNNQKTIHKVFLVMAMCDVEVSIEKVLESRVFQEECMDANTFLAVEERPEHTTPFNEEHKSNEGSKSLPETTTSGKRK